MQPQFIFASLLVGLVAARPQDISFPKEHDDGCLQGKAVPGPSGPVCIGRLGENFGAPCPDIFCVKRLDCDAIKGPNGCLVCPPGC